MPVTVTNIPLQRILFFPFETPASRRRLLAFFGMQLANIIVPVLPGIFSMGYMLQLVRRAATGKGVEMPEWSDWNRMLLDGLKSLLISAAYIVPGWLVMMLGSVFYFASTIWFAFQADSAHGPDAVMPFAILIGMLCLFLGLGLGMVLLFLGAIPYPIALARFAAEGRLAAAFELKEILSSLKSNLGAYVGAWVVMLGIMYLGILAFYIAYMSIICCCPGYLAVVLVMASAFLSWMAMIGLAYGESHPAAAE